jgi:predicted metal-dependent peptidase
VAARHPSAAEKLVRARTQLLLNQPFFGTLCLRLKLIPDAGLPTMATDGRKILYNPEFVDGLTAGELEGVLAHEVLHCALAHPCRRGTRKQGVWNEACDYAVNPILIDNGITLPTDALMNPTFAGLGAEDIYARLDRERESQQSSPDGQPTQASDHGSSGEGASADAGDSAAGQPAKRPGGFGEVLDPTDDSGAPASQAETSRQEHEWKIAAEQAFVSAKACGRTPGGVERPLTESRKQAQDWRAILRDFLAAVDPSDYAWTPPSRRYIAMGLYLPSVIRSGIGEIVIVVDTSGSIGSEELQQFAAEITAISGECRPEQIHVVYADAAVHNSETFGPDDPVVLHPAGGGGTDFRPAFEWVAEQGLVPKCLIYLTDLCCDSYPDQPDYPVLWVTDSQAEGQFGETLHIRADA